MSGREEIKAEERSDVDPGWSEKASGEAPRPPRRSVEGRNSEELEEQIGIIRSEMDSTLREFEAKFSPEKMIERAMHSLQGGPGEYFENLGRAVRDNPVPATLAGIGISWLMATSAKGESGAEHHRAGEIKDAAGEKVHAAGERWRSRRAELSEQKERMSEWMSESTDELAGRARGGFDQLNRFHHQQPLILGAMGIALGAALGASLPGTRREDEVFGPQRDRMMETARETGRQGVALSLEEAEKSMEEAKGELH